MSASSGPRRHIFCQSVPAERLSAPRVVRALRERRIQPIVPVGDRDLEAAVALIRTLRGRGLSVAVWPLFPEGRRRGRGDADAPPALERATRLFATLHSRQALPDEVAIDVEGWLAGTAGRARIGWPGTGTSGRQDASRLLRAVISELHRQGVHTTAAVHPLVTVASASRRRGFHQRAGVELDRLPVKRVRTMACTSLVHRSGRGLVGRADCTALLHHIAAETARRHGPRAALSVGVVEHSGSRHGYRSPQELAEEIAVAAAAGVDDIALHDLSGILARGQLEGWLDALAGVGAAPIAVRPSLKGRAVTRLVTMIGALGDRVANRIG